MRGNEIDPKNIDSDPLRVRSAPQEAIIIGPVIEVPPEVEIKSIRNFMLLDGEKILLHKGAKRAESIPCSVFLQNLPVLSAQFSLTNYRIVIDPNDNQWCYQNKMRLQFFDIPLLLIQRLEKAVDKVNTLLDITTKDGRMLRVVISNAIQSEYNVFPTLYSGAFPQNPINRFAFYHTFSGQVDG